MPEIGETLREARMRAKIDVSEVEARTKIRAKYLRALENEEWGLLPGPTFVRSFLRTYADYLGLDSKLLVEEYRLRHEHPSELDLAPIAPNLGPERRASRIVPPRLSRGWIIGLSVLAIIVLLIVIGSVGGGGQSHQGKVATQSTTKAKAQSPRPAPSPPGRRCSRAASRTATGRGCPSACARSAWTTRRRWWSATGARTCSRRSSSSRLRGWT